MWSILESFSVFKKNVYSTSVAWNCLYKSTRCISTKELFTSSISSLIFCLIVLSIIKRETFKFSTLTVLFSIFHIMSVNVWFIALVLWYGVHIFLFLSFLFLLLALLNLASYFLLAFIHGFYWKHCSFSYRAICMWQISFLLLLSIFILCLWSLTVWL